MTSGIQKILGYTFRDQKLLSLALTHSSAEGELSYERLEFLGDRVLGLVIAHALYDEFKKENEGGLAKRHSALVQGRTLSVIAAMNGIGDHMIMAESERAAGGAENENMLSDVLEALIGAVYLDGGLEPARDMVQRLWGDNIHTLTDAPQDPKTELQEWAQGRGLPLPKYDIVSKDGPDHAPVFDIQVTVEGFDPLTAQGPSRRQAEKTVARLMLRALKEKKS